MLIYIVPNISKNGVAQLALEVAEFLHADGLDIITTEQCAYCFKELVKNGTIQVAETEAEAIKSCDIVLTVGGDGTMLHAAHSLTNTSRPLLGINMGHLGFLTSLEPNEIDKLSRLKTGKYFIEKRKFVEISATPEFDNSEYALNDAVIYKKENENIVSLDIYCDDVLVSSFRGDGVIFSTPTGSTAYSMSAGGPIVDAGLNAIVVTQICAHVVQMPSMVFSSERVLKVVNRLDSRANNIIIDGKTINKSECSGNIVYIKQSDKYLQLVQFEQAAQLKFIDKKLKLR